ncbi:MAG: hypothetical protein HGB17_04425, partial [Syntrophobacteraceae bacterium]|nr:hypothetical protein [Syntrophobacteraceae bacterium]
MKESVFQSKMVNIISQFTAAITNLRLYSHAHALVSQHMARAHNELSQLLDLKSNITVFIVGDELVLNNRSLLAAGQTVERFVRVIREKGVERIT